MNDIDRLKMNFQHFGHSRRPHIPLFALIDEGKKITLWGFGFIDVHGLHMQVSERKKPFPLPTLTPWYIQILCLIGLAPPR